MITLAVPMGGEPDEQLLLQFFDEIRASTYPVELLFGMDVNTPAHIQAIVRERADDVLMFPEDSYWRPGCIWYKIWTCWQTASGDYLAWSGYDDYSAPTRFAVQVAALEGDPEAASCHTAVGVIHGTGTVPQSVYDFPLSRAKLGTIAFPAGAPIFRTERLHDGRMKDDILKNAYLWEAYYLTWLASLGPIRYLGKPPLFSYRAHARTVSSEAHSRGPGAQKLEEVRRRIATGYTLDNLMNDWDSLRFGDYVAETRKAATWLS